MVPRVRGILLCLLRDYLQSLHSLLVSSRMFILNWRQLSIVLLYFYINVFNL